MWEVSGMIPEKLSIGIDPGIVSGFAVWKNKEQEFMVVKSCKLFELFEEIEIFATAFPPYEIIVYIEDPNTWKPFFGADRKTISAKLQGAGAVKQTYKHIMEFLNSMNMIIVPKNIQGTRKKISSKEFTKITHWHNATNEHGRDAAMMVYGR